MQAQLVLILLLCVQVLGSDTTWVKARVPSGVKCISSAMSGDGQYAVIGTTTSKILYSSNFGHTFVVSSSPSRTWEGVSMTGAGHLVVAVSCDAADDGTYTGEIWRSIDYGVTWTQSSAVDACRGGVAMSNNGQFVVAIEQDGFIWYSNDHGRNFAKSSSPEGKWTAIDIDWTGQYAIAQGVNLISRPYYSTDFGVTWTRSANGGEGGPALAMSANGSFAIASSRVGGAVRTSVDYGQTWQDRFQTHADHVTALATDSTGRFIIAGLPYFELSRSTTFGKSWNYINPPSDVWMGFSLSANGTHALALTGKNAVYYSDDPFGRGDSPIQSLVIFTVIISLVAGVLFLILVSVWMRKPRTVSLEQGNSLYTSATVEECKFDGERAAAAPGTGEVELTAAQQYRPPIVRIFNDLYGRYATAFAEVATAETRGAEQEDVVEIDHLDLVEGQCEVEIVVAAVALQV